MRAPPLPCVVRHRVLGAGRSSSSKPAPVSLAKVCVTSGLLRIGAPLNAAVLFRGSWYQSGDSHPIGAIQPTRQWVVL